MAVFCSLKNKQPYGRFCSLKNKQLYGRFYSPKNKQLYGRFCSLKNKQLYGRFCSLKNKQLYGRFCSLKNKQLYGRFCSPKNNQLYGRIRKKIAYIKKCIVNIIHVQNKIDILNQYVLKCNTKMPRFSNGTLFSHPFRLHDQTFVFICKKSFISTFSVTFLYSYYHFLKLKSSDNFYIQKSGKIQNFLHIKPEKFTHFFKTKLIHLQKNINVLINYSLFLHI